MKKIYLLFLVTISINCHQGFSQLATVDNYEGQWINGASWQNGVSPGYNISAFDIGVNGYMSVGTYDINQDFTFETTGGANPPNFIINDTLVVFGNVIHQNKGHNIIIGSKAIFIVFGNFTANNQIQISSGGKFIVKGDLTFSTSPQDDFVDNGGDLYVFGTVTNNAAASTADENSDFSTEPESLQNFVNDGGQTPLPITLKSFTASINNNNIYLDWVTAKEENFSHFEVERSIDQKNFELIGIVQGLGESLSDVAYALTDNNPSFGKIYYRLKAVDIDDTFEYSPVISIENGFNGQLSVYPNPIESIANIKIRVPEAFKENLSHLALYDLQGSIIQEFTGFDPNQDLVVKKALKSGMYLLKVNHNGLEENIRIMVR